MALTPLWKPARTLIEFKVTRVVSIQRACSDMARARGIGYPTLHQAAIKHALSL